MLRDRAFLHLGVEHEKHRRHRRRHRDLVGAHRGFAEMAERTRQVVPLDEVAHHRAGVLHRVHPFAAGRTLGGVDGVADHHVDRRAVAPGVVERHRGMLQADGAVGEGQQRLAFDLGVAVRHRDRGFLVGAGVPVDLEIIDERLLQSAEARAGIACDVLDAEAPDDVGHVVGAAAPLDDGRLARMSALHRGVGSRCDRARRAGLLGRLRLRVQWRPDGRRAGDGRALEQAAPAQTYVIHACVIHAFRHEFLPMSLFFVGKTLPGAEAPSTPSNHVGLLEYRCRCIAGAVSSRVVSKPTPG